MGQKARLPLPLVTNPTEKLCVVIQVPDEISHRAAFWGVLWELAKAYSWENDPFHRAVDVASVWRDIYFEAQENEGCMFIKNIRINGCILEYTYDGVTWIPFGNFDECYVELAPSGPDDNLIVCQTPTTRAARMRAAVGQSAPIQDWQLSDGTVITTMRSDAKLSTTEAFIQQIKGGTSRASTVEFNDPDAGAISRASTLAKPAHKFFRTTASGEIDIVQWLNNGGTLWSAIDYLGRFRNKLVTGIPTDAPAIKGGQAIDAASGKFYIHVDSGWKEIGVGTGPAGADGASVELRNTGTAIEWRQDDDDPTWTNLVDLVDITGPAGADGAPGADGADGAPGADGITELFKNWDGGPNPGETIRYRLFCPADGFVMLPCRVSEVSRVTCGQVVGWWTDEIYSPVSVSRVQNDGYHGDGSIYNAEMGVNPGSTDAGDPVPSAAHMTLNFGLAVIVASLPSTAYGEFFGYDVGLFAYEIDPDFQHMWFFPNCPTFDGNSGGMTFDVDVHGLCGLELSGSQTTTLNYEGLDGSGNPQWHVIVDGAVTGFPGVPYGCKLRLSEASCCFKWSFSGVNNWNFAPGPCNFAVDGCAGGPTSSCDNGAPFSELEMQCMEEVIILSSTDFDFYVTLIDGC